MSKARARGRGADRSDHPPGLWPVPGDGVLARHGDLILLSSIESGQLVDVLLDLLEDLAAEGADGRRFADVIADALDTEAQARANALAGAGAGGDVRQGEPAGGAVAAEFGPSVLAFGPAGAGLAVTIGGGAWAEVTTRYGAQRIEAGQPGMLIRCLLHSPVSTVRGGLGQADDGAAPTDRFSRLDGGTVRASGLSFYVGARAAAHAARDALAAMGAPGAAVAGQQAAGARETASAAVSAPALEPTPTPEPVPAAEPAPRAKPAPAAEPAPSAKAAPVVEPAPAMELPPAVEPAAPVELPPAVEPAAPVEPTPSPSYTPAAPERGPVAPAQADWQPAGPPDQAEHQATIPPMPIEPFEAVLLLNAGADPDVRVPERQPLAKAKDLPLGAGSYVSDAPIIQGVYCKNGHFDDPQALFCAVCGISMNQQTLVPRPGPRPPLGVLLLDDGSVFQLDSDYVVGREPSLDASVAAGKARALRVADETGIVSRVHARLHLDGWRVTVTDLGSANGTRVKLPGQSLEQPLAPQVPLVLATGSQIDLGGRGFRYESHRGR